MTARFVLSFDCEGKWGVADHLTPELHAALTDAALRRAYAVILATLDEYDVAATFAFVGTFALGPRELDRLRPALQAHARDIPGYLEPVFADLDTGTRQGWSGDWAVAAVTQARAGHELALHGGTHVPFDWPGMTESVARRDLALIGEAAAPLLSGATTFVHPRNRVAHLEVLDEFGIAGYRGSRIAPTRLHSLTSEFNILARPDQDPPARRPLEVPPGRFVNHRVGLRRAVPRTISRTRARNLLLTAARTGGVVHCWTHPENIASAPSTLGVLRDLLVEVARLRDAGRCEVLTQAEYCRSVDPDHVAGCAARRAARSVQS